jgi:Asp-tRNA(Asn)/Glu-tRNA(Gln) amidotransferase B subunit
MSEDRMRILTMLAEGKISADEAESLLDALTARATAASAASGADASATGPAIKGDPAPLIAALPKYLYVKVNAENGDNVDVKIPIALVRSGLKLTSLIPPTAMDQINDSMTEHGISIDFNNLKPEDIDELISALREMEISVDSANGDKVRVYCA